MYIKNAIKHFKLITHHKWLVFKLCCKIGEPWRGFMHDWSKYSPTEFFESVKYYQGTHSPTVECKRINGYSNAWLHHKGRNKHHFDYWYNLLDGKAAVIPYKYTVEMICDNIAAVMTYKKDVWDESDPLNYYLTSNKSRYINPAIDRVLVEAYASVEKNGIDETINPKTLKKIYNKYVDKKIKE